MSDHRACSGEIGAVFRCLTLRQPLERTGNATVVISHHDTSLKSSPPARGEEKPQKRKWWTEWSSWTSRITCLRGHWPKTAGLSLVTKMVVLVAGLFGLTWLQRRLAQSALTVMISSMGKSCSQCHFFQVRTYQADQCATWRANYYANRNKARAQVLRLLYKLSSERLFQAFVVQSSSVFRAFSASLCPILEVFSIDMKNYVEHWKNIDATTVSNDRNDNSSSFRFIVC